MKIDRIVLIGFIFLVLLGIYKAVELGHSITTLKALEKRLVLSDTNHYLRIAEAFYQGDWTMSYVKKSMAHRQPFYPTLLSVVNHLNKSPSNIKYYIINAVFFCLTLVALFLLSKINFQCPWSGLAGMVLYLSSSFVMDMMDNLITEIVYMFFVSLVVGFYYKFSITEKYRWLYLSCFFCGWAYLTRPNGLFLLVAILFFIPFFDRSFFRNTKKCFAQIISCLGIFLLVSLPSWLPKLIYHRNPFYHGYLSNYLWARSYEEAHIGGPPRYSLGYFIQNNDAIDVAQRIVIGLKGLFWEGLRTDNFYFVYALSFLAMFFMAGRRSKWFCLWIIASVAPGIWTLQANPDPRVSLSTLVPFLIFNVMCFLNLLWIRHKVPETTSKYLRSNSKI